MRIKRLLLALPAALSLGCARDTPTGPLACSASTGTVTVTVARGSALVFDWSPQCAVALLLVEQDASDQWALGAPGLEFTSTESSNIIVPPVTYGLAPPGTESTTPATLVAGQTYEVVLWRAVSPNITAPCVQRVQNACLMAVHQFTR